MILFLLSSGLFLGWSLGANDAANVFGTAVATRMVKFRTAAITSGIFVILGAVISGAGAAGTLGDLGAVNALGGSFMVALAAGLAVMWMTKAGLPVSVSQAIVGAIIGWNLFTGSRTDVASLLKIVSTWVVCPVLAAGLAALLYLALRSFLKRSRIHLLELDAVTRAWLLIAGALGAYALGANNIANVMGVFVPAFPAGAIQLLGPIYITHAQILFLVGGVAIAVGVFSYSHRVMMTVGRGLFKLTPVTALIVVLAEATVLFLFASEGLENWLISHNLPPVPLVPVSSSQAVIGAVIGIALVKSGGRGMRITVLRKVVGGWAATPLTAAVLAFFGLFFLQNVFGLTVYRPRFFALSDSVSERVVEEGLADEIPADLVDVRFDNARAFGAALKERTALCGSALDRTMDLALVDVFVIDSENTERLDREQFTLRQYDAVEALAGRSFQHRWELREALIGETGEWEFLPRTRRNYLHNKRLEERLEYVYAAFRVPVGGECGSEPAATRGS